MGMRMRRRDGGADEFGERCFFYSYYYVCRSEGWVDLGACLDKEGG
jgi:hypothetical protein